MKQAKSRTFICEECEKSCFVKNIGEYQFKYHERIGRNMRKTHYFCSDSCKKKWTDENIIVHNSFVLCPFYVSEDKTKITCNITSDLMRNATLNYCSVEDKKNYKKHYCCKNYSECEFAKEKLKREG